MQQNKVTSNVLVRLMSVYLCCLQAGPVVDAGGIFEYARQTGMIKQAATA